MNILNPISADKLASCVGYAMTLVVRDIKSFYRNLGVEARNPTTIPVTITYFPQPRHVELIRFVSILPMTLCLDCFGAYLLLIPHNAIADMDDVRYIPHMATLIVAQSFTQR